MGPGGQVVIVFVDFCGSARHLTHAVDFGFIKITSSDNNELKRYVASHVGQTIIVIPNFPYQIFDTDTFEVVPGCKHDLDDCENKFDNLVNYGGFPFTPRADEIA